MLSRTESMEETLPVSNQPDNLLVWNINGHGIDSKELTTAFICKMKFGYTDFLFMQWLG